MVEYLMYDNDDSLEFNCTGYVRLILMLFICLWAFGSPEPTGILNSLSGFAIPAFFVLSGYYVPVMILSHTSLVFSKRMFFEFFVMNLWPLPIGDNIWFIQAMLYAYILIFIADKLKLLRFYRIALISLFIFMLLTGEFSGVIRFNVLGYPYIPGN